MTRILSLAFAALLLLATSARAANEDFKVFVPAQATATTPGATDYYPLVQGAATHKVPGTSLLYAPNNLSDLISPATARTNLGLGTFATQNSATPPAIGGTTPAAGAFTTLGATGAATLSGGGALSGTFTGSPILSGVPKLTGLSAGTQVSCLGLDSSNNIVLLASACGSGAGIGTFTSVALSVPGSSIFGGSGSPVTSAGTLGLTTAGTSGGIPYFSSSSVLSSSGVLGANLPLFGGGAGASPIAGTRSGNTTAVVTTTGTQTSGDCVKIDANGNHVANGSACGGGGGSGTVTSVALSLPAFITVSGSPVTTAGTLTGALATQTANTHFAGPASGSAAAPTFRALVVADLPGVTDTTKTTSYPTVAGDMGNAINLGGSGATLTLSVASSTHFAPGQTLSINARSATGNWTLTNSTGLTYTGPTTLVPGCGGTFVANVDAATLDFFGSCVPTSVIAGLVLSSSAPSNQFATGISTAGAVTYAQPAFTNISGTATVAQGGTGLTSGTSGGILAYTASGTLASSAALTIHGVVIGGGAGAAPTSTAAGTAGQVLTSNGASADPTFQASSGSGGGGMFGYSDNGLTLTAGTRFVPIYGSGVPSTTEADYATKSPSATTAANLQVNLSADPGAGQTLVATLRKAGADTALTCTVTGGSGAICQDLTHSVTIAQNDLIDWKIVTTGTYVSTPSVTILANNGTSAVGVTSVTGTAPIAVATGTTTPVVSINDTAVTPGSYTSANITVDQKGRLTAAANGSGGSSVAPIPQGRLTLVTGTPVTVSDQTAKSQVFYDCYAGNSVPYWTGSASANDTIASCEVSTTMATSGTGVTNTAGVFDVWWEGNTNHNICVATNGSGGGWASDTGGSNTARGTGYSQVHNTKGYWTNVNSITSCYNGTTNYGTITADKATYLGTLFTTSAGQTAMVFAPSAASGGNNSCLCLFNAYNQVRVESRSSDSTSSWTSATSGWQTSNHLVGSGTSNRVNWVDGLGFLTAQATFSEGFGNDTSAAGPSIGILFDASSGTPGRTGFMTIQSATNNQTVQIGDTLRGAVGLHFAQAMENPGGTNATYFGSVALYALTVNITN